MDQAIATDELMPPGKEIAPPSGGMPTAGASTPAKPTGAAPGSAVAGDEATGGGVPTENKAGEEAVDAGGLLNLSRRELQTRCKALGIQANMKSAEMVEALLRLSRGGDPHPSRLHIPGEVGVTRSSL